MDMPNRKTFKDWAHSRSLNEELIHVHIRVDPPRAKTLQEKLANHKIHASLDVDDIPLIITFYGEWLVRYGAKDRLDREMSFTFFEQAIRDTIKLYIPEHFHPDDEQIEIVFPGDVSIVSPPSEGDSEDTSTRPTAKKKVARKVKSTPEPVDEDDEDEEEEKEYGENEGPNFNCPDCGADIENHCHIVTKVTVYREYTSDDVEFTWDEDSETREASIGDTWNDFEDMDESTNEQYMVCQKCGHEFDQYDMELDSADW